MVLRLDVKLRMDVARVVNVLKTDRQWTRDCRRRDMLMIDDGVLDVDVEAVLRVSRGGDAMMWSDGAFE